MTRPSNDDWKQAMRDLREMLIEEAVTSEKVKRRVFELIMFGPDVAADCSGAMLAYCEDDAIEDWNTRATYTEICKNEKCPRGGMAIEVVRADVGNAVTSSSTVSLLPCPFCGCDDIHHDFWASLDAHGPGCFVCGATAETDEAWNKRTPLPCTASSG